MYYDGPPLPLSYNSLTTHQRKQVREEYVLRQNGKCYHCKGSLEFPVPQDILEKKLDLDLFPPGFLDHPTHLHHDHDTGLTIGAVHAYCNGILWQYHGE